MSIVNQMPLNIITNWWPVSDEEWERLNFPERFELPKKVSYTIQTLTH